MMKLQTQVPLSKAQNPINYKSRVFLIGSCFVENIGNKLDYYKFECLQNPFGILFHPLAIENIILRAINELEFKADEVFLHNERWQCFDVHSVLGEPRKEHLLFSLNETLKNTKKEISNASHIIITLGSAWAYKHIETKAFVANCHKVNQKEFSKELLSVQDITTSLKHLIEAIGKHNKKTELIFTISPIRHIKDGFVENQRSKSHLFTALHQILENGTAKYFPAYEVIMDELRDYRYYQPDMVHLNAVAIDYIWERFMKSWVAENSLEVMQKVEEIQKGLNHRPHNYDSKQHQKFVDSLEEKIAYLQKTYPNMKFK